MVKLLLLLLLLLPRSVSAQENPFPVDSTTKKVSYVGVVQVPGISAKDLYDRAKTFFFRAAKFDARAIIEVDDPTGGVLLAKGTIRLIAPVPGILMGGYNRYSLPIELRFKDGRFRYEMTNIKVLGVPGGLPDQPIEMYTTGNFADARARTKIKEKHLQQWIEIDDMLESFMGSVVKAISQPVVAEKDW